MRRDFRRVPKRSWQDTESAAPAARMSMIYREHRLTPPLDSYVRMLWYCEGYRAAHRKERVLPNGMFQLVIELSHGYIRQWPDTTQSYLDSPALIVGMQSRYSVIDTAGLESMLGIVFQPGHARAFFDMPAHEFYNRDTPLDCVWGSAAHELRERLQQAASPREKFRILEATLQHRLSNQVEWHGAVRYGLAEFQRAPHCRNVLGVARDFGLSRRRFAQLFREQIGITPKLYCRVARFQRVLREIQGGGEVNWADVAVSGGYCDQAHFAHEFREFSGITPGSYLAADRPWLNHVPID